jgi:dissimilatory sulfite reductase (desulfoviridin) alpha/beta subunit
LPQLVDVTLELVEHRCCNTAAFRVESKGALASSSSKSGSSKCVITIYEYASKRNEAPSSRELVGGKLERRNVAPTEVIRMVTMDISGWSPSLVRKVSDLWGVFNIRGSARLSITMTYTFPLGIEYRDYLE